MGVLFGWWHGYAYTSVSRAFLFSSWQTLGKPYVTQTSGKPYVMVLYRKSRCGARQYTKRNARETLVYAYPCHQPYSTPNTIGPSGTSWRVATSGVYASKAFLERYSRHIGFSYIILLHSVFLMFGLHRVFLVSAGMRKETLEKRLYTRTHATNHISHPIL